MYIQINFNEFKNNNNNNTIIGSTKSESNVYDLNNKI